MRHIDLHGFKPSDEWIERASVATKELTECKTHDERLAYMKAKSQVWRDLRDELIATYGPKCWFTDAPEYVAKLDVEHFRPKGKAVELDGTERIGYWWLAFAQENLRLCGQIPNREYKRCFFPLHKSSKVANSESISWRDETRVFLDPVELDDVLLVVYGEDGGLHARASASEWDKSRVEVTNKIFGLSAYPLLVEARQKVWQKCAGLIAECLGVIKEEAGLTEPSLTLKEKRSNIVRQLKDMTEPNEPFASVATSCLQMSGHSWAQLIASQQHKRK